MTGLESLGTALEETEEWISALTARLGWQDREKVHLALLAGLDALRDSLLRDEAGYLGTQLPVLLRGLYFEGRRPGSHIPRAKSRTGFLERIEEGVRRDPGIDPEQVAHCVFSLLTERLPAGELEDTKADTPSALRMFWPD